jgi:hypothetical protein
MLVLLEVLLVQEELVELVEMEVMEEILQLVQIPEVLVERLQVMLLQLEVLLTLEVLLDIHNKEVLHQRRVQRLLRALEEREVQVVMLVTEETDLLLESVLVSEEREELLVFLVQVTLLMLEVLLDGSMLEQSMYHMQQET